MCHPVGGSFLRAFMTSGSLPPCCWPARCLDRSDLTASIHRATRSCCAQEASSQLLQEHQVQGMPCTIPLVLCLKGTTSLLLQKSYPDALCFPWRSQTDRVLSLWAVPPWTCLCTVGGLHALLTPWHMLSLPIPWALLTAPASFQKDACLTSALLHVVDAGR